MTRTVIMMPWGRVGSNMVNSVLQRHGVKVFNEPLTGILSRNAHLPHSEVAKLQLDWLEEMMVEDGRLLCLNHAAISSEHPEGITQWLARNRPGIVTLDRRDDLAVALSSARTEAWIDEGHRVGETRNWAVKRDVKFLPVLPPEKIRKNLQIVRKGRQLMRELVGDLPVLRLWYEDLVHDRTGTITAILRTVGVTRPLNIQVTSRRFGSDVLSQLVANPEDFRSILDEEGSATALRI